MKQEMKSRGNSDSSIGVNRGECTPRDGSRSIPRAGNQKRPFVAVVHNPIMLPPLQEHRRAQNISIMNMSLYENDIEQSVSPMSTMSGSVGISSFDSEQDLTEPRGKQLAAVERYASEERKHVPVKVTTEFSDTDRVNDCSDLEGLILNRTATTNTESFASDSSGASTDGSDPTQMTNAGSIFVGKYLASSIGELVVKASKSMVKEESDRAARAPPNTPTPEERDDVPSALRAGETEDVRLELEDSSPGKSEDFIRDIYFVPVPSSASGTTLGCISLLGLKLGDASCSMTHPQVLTVEPTSPLYERIFQGDFILGINGADTAGLSVSEVVDLLKSSFDQNDEKTRFIKFTVMSSNAEEWSGSGDTEKSSRGSNSLLDVGLADSAVEI